MTPRAVVVATRSKHKLNEILQILPSIPGLTFSDLDSAGIAVSLDEQRIEVFDSFEENALAKARYYLARGGAPVLADDSGLCVDALGGAPGVMSRRYSGADHLSGATLDAANNDRLLHDLEGVDEPGRTARYVCVIAIATPSGAESLFRGTVEGTILTEPKGTGGFGYDPLFYIPALEATLAEVDQSTKNRLSHRAMALEAALPTLRSIAANPFQH